MYNTYIYTYITYMLPDVHIYCTLHTLFTLVQQSYGGEVDSLRAELVSNKKQLADLKRDNEELASKLQQEVRQINPWFMYIML